MTDQNAGEKTAQGRVNKTALIIGAVMAAVAAAGIYFTFNFVGQEKERDLKAWQIRLGIVSDSRVADVNKWIDRNFTVMRELAENASLQLYMTELAINGEDKPQGTDELAQAGYLRNLLVATANRTGFTPPAPVEEVAANVERVGIAGIGLFDATGQPLVSTPGMPPVTGKIRTAAAQALNGEPAIIDIYEGASGLPTMGFALPVFAIQGDDTKGIGAVVGIRTVGKDLFDRLKQPGETEKSRRDLSGQKGEFDPRISFAARRRNGAPEAFHGPGHPGPGGGLRPRHTGRLRHQTRLRRNRGSGDVPHGSHRALGAGSKGFQQSGALGHRNAAQNHSYHFRADYRRRRSSHYRRLAARQFTARHGGPGKSQYSGGTV